MCFKRRPFQNVPGEGFKEMLVPIALVKQEGMIEIPIQMTSQLARDEEVWEVFIRPEGALVRKHTSVLLDLKNRALFYEFLNIPVDQSPVCNVNHSYCNDCSHCCIIDR